MSFDVLGRPSPEATASAHTSLDADLEAVLERFREFIPIMTAKPALRLPDHNPVDHKVYMLEGKALPRERPLLAMSVRKLPSYRGLTRY